MKINLEIPKTSNGTDGQGNTIIEALNDARIFNVKKLDNDKYRFEDSCDNCFQADLTKNQVISLVEELNDLIKYDDDNNYIDKFLENESELAKEILKSCNINSFSFSSYLVCSGNEIVCHTQNIVDADNVCTFLIKKFPNIKFQISNQHISFEAMN